MNRHQLATQLARLTRVYAIPRHYPPDVDQLVDVYLEHLGDLDPAAADHAVTHWLRSAARFFPTPGQLRSHALERPGARTGTTRPGSHAHYLAYESSSWGASVVSHQLTFQPCPVCHATPYDAGPDTGIRLVHDHQAHAAAGIPAIGLTDRIVRWYANGGSESAAQPQSLLPAPPDRMLPAGAPNSDENPAQLEAL